MRFSDCHHLFNCYGLFDNSSTKSRIDSFLHYWGDRGQLLYFRFERKLKFCQRDRGFRFRSRLERRIEKRQFSAAAGSVCVLSFPTGQTATAKFGYYAEGNPAGSFTINSTLRVNTHDITHQGNIPVDCP